MSNVNLTSSRAIIGSIYESVNSEPDSWADEISVTVPSNQAKEDLVFLGFPPAVAERLGPLELMDLRANKQTVENKHFQAGIEVQVQDLRRDKTMQIMQRARELGVRMRQNKARIISELLKNGDSVLGYDGVALFAADHKEGNNQVAQSNKISVDVSELPGSTTGGSKDDPTGEQMSRAIMKGITKIMTFVDDQKEPLHGDGGGEFIAIVPPGLAAAAAGVTAAFVDPGQLTSNNFASLFQTFDLKIRINPRLLTWTDQFVVAEVSGMAKPVIITEETPIMASFQGQDSELEFRQNKHAFKVDQWMGVAPGMWHKICHITLI